MIEKAILMCSCGGQYKKAKEAFELLFPNEPFPPVYKGRDVVWRLAKARDNEHLKAIAKLTGRYMYYVELEGNDIIKEYNLTNGRRIR